MSGVTVKVSGFNRVDSNGAWSTSYLGVYPHGLGVTNFSEGNGDNDRHVVDNVGGNRDYVLFEFSTSIVVDQAYLDYILGDSDMSAWIGTTTDPINNHNTLSDAFLTSIGPREDNDTTSSNPRWADINATNRSGNVLVISASASDTTPEDGFKIRKLLLSCGGGTPSPTATATATATATSTPTATATATATATPTATATVTATATPTATATATATVTPTPTCPTITVNPSTLPDGTVGNSYHKNITASGGRSPYTFIVLSGSLPPGLTLFSSGTFAGTPTTEGTFTFTIQATDRNGCTGQRQYTVTIACPEITLHPPTLSDGTVGRPYHKNISASGGNNPYTFMVSDGSLPPGLTLFSSGTLAGTPTAEGIFTFTIQATDSYGCTGNRQYTIKIDCPTITVKPFSLPKGMVNHPYSRIITASGGNSPYTFTLENGSLPNGLTLSPGGLLSGTPTAEGSSTFTILATDSYGCTGKRQHTLGIDGCPSITVKPFTLPNGTVGHSYNRTITATGGDGPYTFILLSGSLPPGLTLTSGGTLSGTPTAQGGFTFTIQANDSFGCTGKRKYTIVIGHN